MRRTAPLALALALAAALALTAAHRTPARVLLQGVHAAAEARHIAATTTDALAAAPLVERAFYGRRLEPREPVVLHGAGQSDPESFAAYTAAVAPSRPMLSMSYVDLHDDLPTFFTRLREELAAYPQLIVPQIGLSMNEGDAKKHYEQQVADGADDARLQALCAGLKSLDRPVFLRIGYEFNGSWNGYRPAAYVAAFRHVSQELRSCGLENVAMVWDISAEAELDAENGGARVGEAAQRWAAFYPGDAWVDWWAINLFRTESLTAQATRDFLAEADRRRFPVMIGESTSFHHGAGEGQRAVDAWFAPYFGLIRGQRSIKAFCYIDWNWSRFPQWADWGDDRIERDPTVLAFYRRQVSAPLVAGARDRAQTLRLLRAR